MKKTLWYNGEAADWNSALPLGNGRLGAMVFGGKTTERLSLNEESIWAGPPVPERLPTAAEGVKEAAALMKEGKLDKAEAALEKKVMAERISPRSYQPLGDLWLSFQDMEILSSRRELNIEEAVSRVERSLEEGALVEESFISAPEQALVLNLTNPAKKGAVTITLTRREESRMPRDNGNGLVYHREESSQGDETSRVFVEKDTLFIEAQASHGNAHRGVKFLAALKLVSDGKIRFDGESVRVDNFSSLTLALNCETSYLKGEPPYDGWSADSAPLTAALDKTLAKGFAELRSDHAKDYRSFYDRCDLDLDAEESPLPVNERMEALEAGSEDKSLAELLFHYARYLMISCSRPDTLSSNLQGIWSDLFEAPWNADYHININIQMIYWIAESCGLSDCHNPLFNLSEALLPDARQTAREIYGCRGAVMHHTTDAWHWSRPMGQIRWGFWPMGGPWLALHFAEHCRHTGDKAFMKDRALPFIEENVLFFLDFLDKNEKGEWETPLSTSPENSYLDKEGKPRFLCRGSSMDQEIIWELFSAYLELLGGEKTDFSDEVARRLPLLKRPGIDSRGRVMEWDREYEESEPGHRHISHLFGLFPGTLFYSENRDAFLSGADKTIQARLAHGGGHTGWSMGWLMLFRSRLGQGEELSALLNRILKDSTYPNMMDAHPPFQLDGNMGSAAAVAEALVQSHERRDGKMLLRLLPALPSAWPKGSARNLRCRGGLDVSLRWEEGKLAEATIINPRGIKIIVVMPDGREEIRREEKIDVTC